MRHLQFPLIIAIIALPSLAFASPQPAAHALIASLGDRIYSAGELTGERTGMVEAERQVVMELKALIAAKPSAATERNSKGETPLMAAASWGYAEVVRTLLSSDAVRHEIEAKDPNKATAWVIASQGMAQGIFACQQTRAKDNFLPFISIFATLPYYLGVAESPYLTTRTLLESAGAQKDLATAKMVWEARCTGQTTETRDAIAASDDMLKTVLDTGIRSMLEVVQQLQKGR